MLGQSRVVVGVVVDELPSLLQGFLLQMPVWLVLKSLLGDKQTQLLLCFWTYRTIGQRQPSFKIVIELPLQIFCYSKRKLK